MNDGTTPLFYIRNRTDDSVEDTKGFSHIYTATQNNLNFDVLNAGLTNQRMDFIVDLEDITDTHQETTQWD